jgi:hypothetical protein
MRRGIGDAAIWSIVSKRTETKMGVGLTAGWPRQQPASRYTDVQRGETPSRKATQRTVGLRVLIRSG